MSLLYRLLEKDFFPDWLIRIRIRRLLKVRLRQENRGTREKDQEHLIEYVRKLKESPIAIHTNAANEQHYEVPSDFFRLVMGRYMKYSSGFWASPDVGIDESERAMLELTCKRAGLKDGMTVLDLGCGWGSLSLYVAETYPKCKILGVSNSGSQKKYIDAEAGRRGLRNLTIQTADANVFKTNIKFDRILSVEMLEHVRNYEALFERLAGFLKKDGLFFIHIFTHKTYAYAFEVVDDTDWMAKYFFTGGQMPSHDLLLYFQKDFLIEDQWVIDGKHYSLTSEAWLRNMYSDRMKILGILERTYGKENALKWFVYWKVFFLSCAELWKFRNGEEWAVSHYLFRKR
ncbi:class I SAM-dependent methyltransferase [Leptospira fluminis]|uniref:Class I SAM-dependent methyltransferase n=1 Tax=Leptospira fluminis TaxID=2484979 RepID=A0A4R9GRB2_9LEPT|nr:cyclopropane-fatty-acyl-phospholipid synthase family protein [Leptospira fluminis]TGK20089.1 class I SAM-dependent methyltransferase [Leptospira fluminis]